MAPGCRVASHRGVVAPRVTRGAAVNRAPFCAGPGLVVAPLAGKGFCGTPHFFVYSEMRKMASANPFDALNPFKWISDALSTLKWVAIAVVVVLLFLLLI